MILENFMHIYKLVIFMGVIYSACIFFLSTKGRKIPEVLTGLILFFWTP